MHRADAGPRPLRQHHFPQGLNISQGTRCSASPTLLPPKPNPKAAVGGDAPSSHPQVLGGGNGGTYGRNRGAQGRSRRAFAKRADSRGNYALNACTFVQGRKMLRGAEAGSSPALPPATAGAGKEQIQSPFIGKAGKCPSFGAAAEGRAGESVGARGEPGGERTSGGRRKVKPCGANRDGSERCLQLDRGEAGDAWTGDGTARGCLCSTVRGLGWLPGRQCLERDEAIWQHRPHRASTASGGGIKHTGRKRSSAKRQQARTGASSRRLE